jgi:hypothetical protein
MCPVGADDAAAEPATGLSDLAGGGRMAGALDEKGTRSSRMLKLEGGSPARHGPKSGRAADRSGFGPLRAARCHRADSLPCSLRPAGVDLEREQGWRDSSGVADLAVELGVRDLTFEKAHPLAPLLGQGVADGSGPAVELRNGRDHETSAREHPLLHIVQPCVHQGAQAQTSWRFFQGGHDDMVHERGPGGSHGGELQTFLRAVDSLDATLGESELSGHAAEADTFEPLDRGDLGGTGGNGTPRDVSPLPAPIGGAPRRWCLLCSRERSH